MGNWSAQMLGIGSTMMMTSQTNKHDHSLIHCQAKHCIARVAFCIRIHDEYRLIECRSDRCALEGKCDFSTE